MKKFNFEYTSQKAVLMILILCFAVFGFLIFLLIKLKGLIGIENKLEIIISVAIAMIIPYLLFLTNKKKLKIYGIGLIYDNYVELQLTKSIINVNYEDIKSYTIQFYNGVQLTFKMKDGKKIKLFANENFCKPGQFELFCESLEQSIENYYRENNITSRREKSMFEKKWVYYFLIIMTCFIVIAGIFSIFHLKKVTSSFFMAIGGTATLWGGYLSTKAKKKKKTDN